MPAKPLFTYGIVSSILSPPDPTLKRKNKHVYQFVRLILALFTLFMSGLSLGANYHSKTTLEVDIRTNIKTGEFLNLKQNQQSYAAIYTPSLNGPPHGGAIILHDASSNADNEQLIQPIRIGLAQGNWATLSLNWNADDLVSSDLKTSTFDSPLAAGIAELRSRGINNIIIVSHGIAALPAMTYLASNSAEQLGIVGYVAISANEPDVKKEESVLFDLLTTVPIPMLDIFAERDFPQIVINAEKRARTARISGEAAAKVGTIEGFRQSPVAQKANKKSKGFIAYRQVQIPATDHNFTAAQDHLIKRVLGWNKRHAQGITIVRSP